MIGASRYLYLILLKTASRPVGNLLLQDVLLLISGLDLIHNERASPFPLRAGITVPESPRNAYELISFELAYFAQNYLDETKRMPRSATMQLEACRIIFAAETLASPEETPGVHHMSWLRDLLTSDERITQQAQFSPIRTRAESRLVALEIKGKSSIFEACSLESQLSDYVRAWQATRSTMIHDHDLQEEACRIITRMNNKLGFAPSDFVLQWVLRLIKSSTGWLQGFRQALGIPSDHEETNQQVSVPRGLSQQPNLNPSCNATLDKNMNMTEIDSSNSSLFSGCQGKPHFSNLDHESPKLRSQATLDVSHTANIGNPTIISAAHEGTLPRSPSIEEPSLQSPWHQPGIFILNDFNFHQWLGKELRRWALAVMSPNNPNCHIPSDEEIQHHARCLLYEE